MKTVSKALALVVPVLLAAAGCVRVPSGVTTVSAFDPVRYQGTWYEMARLDHSFERGLSNVKATYTPLPDGNIEVWNRGYSTEKSAWQEVKGRAKLLPAPAVGRLKVSFFGPFYGAYNVIALDAEGYRWAMVCGPSRSFLWILARETHLDRAIYDQLVARAAELGFPTAELIEVTHDR